MAFSAPWHNGNNNGGNGSNNMPMQNMQNMPNIMPNMSPPPGMQMQMPMNFMKSKLYIQ